MSYHSFGANFWKRKIIQKHNLQNLSHLVLSGASGHRGGGFPRGGPRGAPRGQSARGRGSGRSHEPLKFDGDYDFESANAQFDKDEIERELKEKLTIGKV